MDLDPDETPEEWAALKKLGADPEALRGRSWIKVLDRDAQQPAWASHQGLSWVELGYTIVLRARRFGEQEDCWAALGRDGQIKMPPGTGEWVLHNDAQGTQSALSICFGPDILKAGILPRTVWAFPSIRTGALWDGEGGELSLIERRIGSRVRHLAKKLSTSIQITILRPNTARSMAGAADLDRDLILLWEQAGRRVKIVPIERVLASVSTTSSDEDELDGAEDRDQNPADADHEAAAASHEPGPAPAEDPLFAEVAALASSEPVPRAGFWARAPAPAAPAPAAPAPKPAPAPAPVPVPAPPADSPDAAEQILRLARQLDAAQLAAVAAQIAELAAKQPRGSGSGFGAVGFVRSLLAGGKRIPGAEVTRLARAAGHSRDDVKAAKSELRIVADSGSPWTWSLPAAEPVLSSRPVLRSLPKTPRLEPGMRSATRVTRDA